MARKNTVEEPAVLPVQSQAGVTIAQKIGAVAANYNERPVNLDRGDLMLSCLHSRSWALDLSMGGGWAGGRWITILGPEGSGKSTLLYHACAMAQYRGIPVVIFDHEGSADIVYMKNIGFEPYANLRNPLTGQDVMTPKLGANGKPLKTMIPVPSCHYYQPGTGESTYRIMYQILEGLPDVVDPSAGPQALFVVDSFAAMRSENVDVDKNPMGAPARMHSTWIPFVINLFAKKGVILLGTNQIREKIGIKFGNPETEPGGWALKFYPDVKVRVSRDHMLMSKGVVDREGAELFLPCTARTLKNKVFRPFQIAPFRIQLGWGIDRLTDVYNWLEMTKQVSKTSNGRYTVEMEGWNQQSWPWSAATEWLLTDELAQAIHGQMYNGEAFARYIYGKPDVSPDVEEDEDTGAVKPIAELPQIPAETP